MIQTEKQKVLTISYPIFSPNFAILFKYKEFFFVCKKYIKTLVVCNGAVPFKAGIPQRHVPQFKSMTRDHEQVGCIPHICLRISDLNLNTFAAILKIYELYSI